LCLSLVRRVEVEKATLSVVGKAAAVVRVEDLPFSSLNVAFLPARVEAGSEKAMMGNRRTRISFMEGLDVIGQETFTSPQAPSCLFDSPSPSFALKNWPWADR
jgi:hypothetical protein